MGDFHWKIRRTAGLSFVIAISGAFLIASPVRSHDIPNQRVDRSIQVSLKPEQILIDYEVSLTELTLTQDLRALIGTLPGADRTAWLAEYARVTGPLNAKGILVSVDGRPVTLSFRGSDLLVEEHPRYTYHFQSSLPAQGMLSVHDTNFASSEGTSRLAVRGRDGVVVEGDEMPADVDQVPIRPVWQLSDDEERRTKKLDVHYFIRDGQPRLLSESPTEDVPASKVSASRSDLRSNRISALLDAHVGLSWSVLALIAVGLGAVHAIQPGHGKTLVTAVALSPDSRVYQAVLLGVATTFAHMGSVLLVAVGLWFTGTTDVGTLHRGLTQVAGLVIGSAGFWRIGRYLGGFGEHAPEEIDYVPMSNSGIVGLGLASGLVPCWDAVGLLVLAAAVGRLAAGIGLVLAFSLGMAAVLVMVAWVAGKLKSAAAGLDPSATWQRRLGLACGAVLAGIGLYLFFE